MDLVSSVANVVKLALEIKELVETAQQNKELVVTVAKRVERLRAIVECLDNTDVSREQTIIDALNELEETFLRALELVKACQTKNKVWLFITAGDVSKKLRDVKDDIMDHMHIANFSIGVQQTVITDPAVKKRLKKEQEEKEHKKKAHLYIIIKIARDEDLKKQIGRNMYFDLVDHEKVPSFIIKKLLPFSTFKEEVAKEYGIPVQFQRFWLLAKRQNHTYRPNRPLTPHEETQSVGQLREIPNQAQNAELKLFLEVEFGLDLQPLPPPEKSKEDILLFFKLYNPEKEVLCFVGRLFVKALGKPSDIQRKLNEMAGFTPEEEIELFEEIKFEPFVMCEQIDKKLTFRSNMLEDGDIICFQKSPKAGSDTQVRYPDVPSFLEYVRNMQV